MVQKIWLLGLSNFDSRSKCFPGLHQRLHSYLGNSWLIKNLFMIFWSSNIDDRRKKERKNNGVLKLEFEYDIGYQDWLHV